jgi:hypothetical protein
MNADWQTAIELVKQGTAILHDCARHLGTVDDAEQLRDCAERLSLDLAAVGNLAGDTSMDLIGKEINSFVYRTR